MNPKFENMTDEKFEQMTFQDRGVYASNLRMDGMKLIKEGKVDEGNALKEEAKRMDALSQKLLKEYMERENAKYGVRKENSDVLKAKVLRLESLFLQMNEAISEVNEFMEKTDDDLVLHGDDYGETMYFKILGIACDFKKIQENYGKMIDKVENYI